VLAFIGPHRILVRTVHADDTASQIDDGCNAGCGGDPQPPPDTGGGSGGGGGGGDTGGGDTGGGDKGADTDKGADWDKGADTDKGADKGADTDKGADSDVEGTSTPTPTPTPTPEMTFTGTPALITRGQSATLSWIVKNASNCQGTGTGDTAEWNGPKATSGSQVVTPAQTSTYKLTCLSVWGPIEREVTITVRAFQWREIIPRLFPFLTKLFSLR